jgi:hypothetical protein
MTVTTYSIYMEYTWYIPVIWQRMSYDRYIYTRYIPFVIYLSLSFTWYIPVIWNAFLYWVYTWYIPFKWKAFKCSILRSAKSSQVRFFPRGTLWAAMSGMVGPGHRPGRGFSCRPGTSPLQSQRRRRASGAGDQYRVTVSQYQHVLNTYICQWFNIGFNIRYPNSGMYRISISWLGSTSGTLAMFDIKCQTYDIFILRYWLDIDSILNVRKWPSISRYDMKLDIEDKNTRYWCTTISKKHRYRTFYIDIDSSRYRRNVDIEVQNFDIGIYRYRRFSRYR